MRGYSVKRSRTPRFTHSVIEVLTAITLQYTAISNPPRYRCSCGRGGASMPYCFGRFKTLLFVKESLFMLQLLFVNCRRDRLDARVCR